MEEDRKDTIVPESAPAAGPFGPHQRWTVARKREVALRLLRVEPVDGLGP